MTGRKPLATPIRADAHQGLVLVDHDDGLVATFTPDAAEQSAKAIKAAAGKARKKSAPKP
jgi:hypothetical protein